MSRVVFGALYIRRQDYTSEDVAYICLYMYILIYIYTYSCVRMGIHLDFLGSTVIVSAV